MSAPESTHKPSPFPWRDAGEFSSAIIDANGDYVSQQIEEITVADYDRILVCVNACEGLDDPAKEIEAMREAIKAAHEVFNYAADCLNTLASKGRMPTGGEDAGNWEHCVQSHQFAQSALAKLEPFIKP